MAYAVADVSIICASDEVALRSRCKNTVVKVIPVAFRKFIFVKMRKLVENSFRLSVHQPSQSWTQPCADRRRIHSSFILSIGSKVMAGSKVQWVLFF